MEIQQLRHVLAASDVLNYSQAAKNCFTSRQNIAHSIRVIENELNITIFERAGNKMVLTYEGKQVVRKANEIIAKVDDLRDMFVGIAVNKAPLDFAVTHNIFAGIPSSVTQLLSNYTGGIRLIELSCEECYRQVCSRKVDAALILCFTREFPDCSVLEITSSQVFGLVNDRSLLTEKTYLTARDILGRKLMVMSEPVFQYAPLFDELDSLGFDRSDVNIITSTGSMIHMLRRFESVSIVSERFASKPPKGTVAIPLYGSHMIWRFYMLYRTDTKNAISVQQLVQDIQKTFNYAKRIQEY